MAQYVKKLFDGDKKAIFSFTAKIASTTAETFNVDASGLNARNDGTALLLSTLINYGGALTTLQQPNHFY